MSQLRYQDRTGTLMQMLIEHTQLRCGTLEPIFTLGYEYYMTIILTLNWVTEIWSYLGLYENDTKHS
jgi:hypothetical protein